MATPYTGGCACGAVRYECSAEPLMAGNCHCRDYQQSSGAAFSSAFIVPKDAVKITGEVKYYQVKADSGNMATRGFCPNCGSPLFGKPGGMEVIGIRAASLDDPSWYRPAVDIYTSSAQPWCSMNSDLPKFPKMPPM